MKKADRELIFNKYNGKCAYCGEDLQKGWHVDELKPVRRKFKKIPAHWRHKITKQPIDRNDPLLDNEETMNDYEWVNHRQIADGYHHPENLSIDNQMPACPSCNINKHSDTLESFRSLIQGFMKHLNEHNTQYKIAKRYGLVKEHIEPVVFYFEKFKECLFCKQVKYTEYGICDDCDNAELN